MACPTVAVPDMMRSRALPNHTSVPWEKPDSRTKVSNWVGLVSSSMPRTKLVPNSGMAAAPVGPKIGSSSNPSTFDEVKMDMVSRSSRGICLASTPVRSSSIRIMVGSSWPSMSNFKRFSSME